MKLHALYNSNGSACVTTCFIHKTYFIHKSKTTILKTFFFKSALQIDVMTEQLSCTKEELIHNSQYWKQHLNLRTNTIQTKRKRERKLSSTWSQEHHGHYSVLGHVNQTLDMKIRLGKEVLTPHFFARRTGERNTEIDYSRTQLESYGSYHTSEAGEVQEMTERRGASRCPYESKRSRSMR